MTTDAINEILSDPPMGLEFSPPANDRCINYDRCGNTVPGRNAMCGECLDKLRHEGRGHSAGG